MSETEMFDGYLILKIVVLLKFVALQMVLLTGLKIEGAQMSEMFEGYSLLSLFLVVYSLLHFADLLLSWLLLLSLR